MAVTDLLSKVAETHLKPVESKAMGRILARLDEVLAAVEAVQVADRITPAQALIRVEWRAVQFPIESFSDVKREAPKRLRSEIGALEMVLRDRLERLKDGAREGNAEKVLETRDTLISLRNQLEILASRSHSKGITKHILRAAVLVSGIIGGVSAGYLRSDLGTRLIRIEGVSPPAAHQVIETDNASMELEEAYLKDFMLEFSKHYFGHRSQFKSIYYDQSKDGKKTERRTLQHRISLRNASRGHVKYISSVSAVIEVTGEADFPWSRLTVTPALSILDPDPRNPQKLTVKSDGIGPALDVKLLWKADSGLVLSQREKKVLLRGEVEPYSDLAVATRRVRKGIILQPLYRKLQGAPSTPDPRQFLEVGAKKKDPTLPKDCDPAPPEQFGWYEIIRTPEKLREVTTTAYNEPWTLEVRYSSLNSTAENVVQQKGRLDDSQIFWRPAEGLLYEADPRCVWLNNGSGVGHGAGMGELSLEKLAMLFSDEKMPVQPRGNDFLTAQLGVELLRLQVGRRVAATRELGGFLNPQGILAIDLLLNMPDRLRYQVTLQINGRRAASYRFAGLVPDYLTFTEEGPDRAVARLRKVFGVEKPSKP